MVCGVNIKTLNDIRKSTKQEIKTTTNKRYIVNLPGFPPQCFFLLMGTQKNPPLIFALSRNLLSLVMLIFLYAQESPKTTHFHILPLIFLSLLSKMAHTLSQKCRIPSTIENILSL